MRTSPIHHRTLFSVASIMISSGLLCCVLVPPAQAKTVAEYDADISYQAQIVEQENEKLKKQEEKLASTTKWMYKNASNGSLLDLISKSFDVQSAISTMDYASRVRSEYSKKVNETKLVRDAALAEQKKLEELRESRRAQSEALSAKAKTVQFPQFGQNSWSGLSYWGGTIADSGCGVCAYAVMIDVLTGADYDPGQMLSIRGDWVGMDGFPNNSAGTPDRSTHHDWTKNNFDIESWEIGRDVEQLWRELYGEEACAIIVSAGNVFKDNTGAYRWSSGHFVTVTLCDDEGFHVADSAYTWEKGHNVIYSKAEMQKMMNGANHIVIYHN